MNKMNTHRNQEDIWRFAAVSWRFFYMFGLFCRDSIVEFIPLRTFCYFHHGNISRGLRSPSCPKIRGDLCSSGAVTGAGEGVESVQRSRANARETIGSPRHTARTQIQRQSVVISLPLLSLNDDPALCRAQYSIHKTKVNIYTT